MNKENLLHKFGGKIRVRVCGICIENDKMLMLKHLNVGKKGILWFPPGGGVEDGEPFDDALKREFLEETGLEVIIKKLLFIDEFIAPPLHGIELYFEVKIIGGTLSKGFDPELEIQIIDEAKWLSMAEINALDHETKPIFLRNIQSLNDVYLLGTYLKKN